MQKWGKAAFTSTIEGGVWVPIGRMIMFENRHKNPMEPRHYRFIYSLNRKTFAYLFDPEEI